MSIKPAEVKFQEQQFGTGSHLSR